MNDSIEFEKKKEKLNCEIKSLKNEIKVLNDEKSSLYYERYNIEQNKAFTGKRISELESLNYKMSEELKVTSLENEKLHVENEVNWFLK